MASQTKGEGRVRFLTKRFLKKLFNWYLAPLIEQQSLFNTSVIYSMEEIKQYLGVIEQELQKRTDQTQQNVKLLTENLQRTEEQLILINKKIPTMISLSLITMLEAKNEIEQALQFTLATLRETGDQDGLMDKALSLFNKQAVIKLNSQNIQPGNIVLLCQNFQQDQTIEAIKKEAWNLFLALKALPIGPLVKFVSLEETVDSLEYNPQQDVYYCPFHNIGTFLEQLNPGVLHIMETSTWLLFTDNYSLFNYNLVATLSGCNPLGDNDRQKLEEIRHYMDHGSLDIVVESTTSLAICQENHLPRTQLIYPLVNLHITDIDLNAETSTLPPESKTFSVGFASSPMSEEQVGDRGVDLLLQVAAALPEVLFRLAWRNPQVNIEARISQLGLDNIHLEVGFIDMGKFYASVDCMVLPYTSRQNNHACPLSSVEAALLGIPVICTNLVGSSDVITSNNLGKVVKPDASEIVSAIRDIQQGKCRDKNHIRETAGQIFNRNRTLEAYLGIYHQQRAKTPALPLFKWNQELQQAGSDLVKGRENLVSYYSKQDIANNYTETRFSKFPMNCYDAFERGAIKQLILKWLEVQQSATRRLLDIATGDGRILQELLPYGHCIAIDSSSDMLKLAETRCGGADNLEIIATDLFAFQQEQPFDIITCFRILRHLDYAERQTAYGRIQDLLTEEGIVIFDFPNRTAELALRKKHGWHNFNIYDVFWTLDSLQQEVSNNGLEIVNYLSVGEGLLAELEGQLRDEPLIWVVALKKVL